MYEIERSWDRKNKCYCYKAKNEYNQTMNFIIDDELVYR